MTNITMLVHNRPRLTKQAIESLVANTAREDFNLMIRDDAKMEGMLELAVAAKAHLFVGDPTGTGQARNEVIGFCEMENPAQYRKQDDYLYLSDNDIFALPNWLPTLIEAYEWARATHGVVALGAYAHPYLKPRRSWPFFSSVLGRTIQIGELDALPTQSWLWRWEDWDKFGPFCATPPGKVCQSEDVQMSQRIQAAGGKVAAIYPAMVVNCGVTNSFNERIPGYDEVMREYLPEGVYRG